MKGLSITTLLARIKQHVVVVLTSSIGVVTFIYVSRFMYRLGYFTDENPGFAIPTYVIAINWIALFSSIVIPIVCFLLWYRSAKKLAISTLVILIAIFSFWSGGRLAFDIFAEKNDAVSILGNSDSAYFFEINLHALDELLSDQSGIESIVYVARNDCKECSAFEDNIFSFLEELHYGLPTYYTNSDRDGPRSDEMYKLLEKYDIVSVPCALIVKNSTIVKMWDDPLSDGKEIEEYIREHQYVGVE